MCTCDDGYTGSECEAVIITCDPNPCPVGYICMNGIGSYSCVCPNSDCGIINVAVSTHSYLHSTLSRVVSLCRQWEEYRSTDREPQRHGVHGDSNRDPVGCCCCCCDHSGRQTRVLKTWMHSRVS